MTPPVLYLIFNRPDLVERSFARIRDARPSQLFIAADGPRFEREGEVQQCQEARRIIEKVDWDCELKTLFREHNLGCRRAVSEAISWFFNNVEEGIILEDDCLPNRSFFNFCEELLVQYRNDKRVMAITGNNFQQQRKRGEASYYFSSYVHIWGWASWRRAWALNDFDLHHWPQLKATRFLDGFLSEGESRFWTKHFDDLHCNVLDTWDFVWLLSCWQNHGLTATPNTNLVSNIGFDSRATHTNSSTSNQANMPIEEISLPLIHPEILNRHYEADEFVSTNCFNISDENSRPAPKPFLKRAVDKMFRIARKVLESRSEST